MIRLGTISFKWPASELLPCVWEGQGLGAWFQDAGRESCVHTHFFTRLEQFVSVKNTATPPGLTAALIKEGPACCRTDVFASRAEPASPTENLAPRGRAPAFCPRCETREQQPFDIQYIQYYRRNLTR